MIGPVEFILIALIALILPIYLLPGTIAFKRKHHHIVPIIIINILLGWTFVAWVVCVAWSFSPVKKADEN